MKREGLIGIHPVLEALRKGERDFNKVYVSRDKYTPEIKEIIGLCRSRGVPLFLEDRKIITRLAGTSKHQGIFASVSPKRFVSLRDIIKKDPQRAFILVLDRIEDPGNFGALIRTAEGAGVRGIIISTHHSTGITETVAKTSAGALEYMNIVRVNSLTSTLRWLKDEGFWIYGLDLQGESVYNKILYKLPIVVIVGGEDTGIRKPILRLCDALVKIPMFGHVNSLNVSVAAGIILYEIATQVHTI